MKLSLMIPTFQSGETIERTLTSALAQEHRPLEVVVYDECSRDETREIAETLLAAADPEIETRLLTSEENSGPVRAWRVPLHAITGDWCCFVWADDVLKAPFSTRMMGGAMRASEDGRKLVTCSAEIEQYGSVLPYYAMDSGPATPVEYSEGIFLRRFPLTQICSVYETTLPVRYSTGTSRSRTHATTTTSGIRMETTSGSCRSWRSRAAAWSSSQSASCHSCSRRRA